MKNKSKYLALGLALTMTLSACANPDNKKGNNEGTGNKTEVSSKNNGGKHDFSDKLKCEDGVVRWVRGHSGNLMMTMAEHNGYLDEYGLKVEQIPMQTVDESFSAVEGNQVDIVSNAGTFLPLQRIAKGNNLQIFGGHMVEGAGFVVGRKDAEWKDVSSMVGKKVAGFPGNYVISGTLLEMGYNPKEDVEWVQTANAADAIASLKSGQVDYACVGTEAALQVKTDPSLKELAKQGDIMDKYSCCRMETAERFIKDKPNTTKALLKALLRGMRDFEKDPNAASQLLADELDVPLDFVEAYTLDSGYEINPDPLYNSCVRAWAYLDELGFLDENAKNIDLRDHITVDLYKEALDEVIEEVGDEDPEYWEKQKKYFEENNSMYYNKDEEKEYFQHMKDTIEENRAKNAQNK